MKISNFRLLANRSQSKKLTFPYRIGIIDIGSNSIKLRIYEVISESSHKILYEDRNMVRLGSEVFITQQLPESAFQGAAETIKSYLKLMSKFEIMDHVVKATSAVRESKNVNEFKAYIYQETGVVIDVLSGLDEAQYVYLASLSAIEYNGRTLMLVDIGGGSTEVCVAREDSLLFSESLPLGTVRLMEIFFNNLLMGKNYSPDAVHIMQAYCEKKVLPLRDIIRSYQPELILAFGGTPYNLAEVAMRHNLGIEKEGCIGFSYQQCENLYDTFKRSNPEKIQRIKGLDPRRADIILGGTYILKTISSISGNLDILTSPKGLREGIMMEYISSKVNPNIYQQKQEDFRLNAIQGLGEKFNIRMEHGRQVDGIARELFLQLEPIHSLPIENLKILQAVSYLHDIGMVINYRDHHKHSYYLITQADLAGFTQEEKEVIGQIARYHRKSTPRSSHDFFRVLPEFRKKEIMHLSAILRLADSLDQSYENNVENIKCEILPNEIIIELTGKPKADLSLELWSAEKKKSYGEEIWNKKILIVEKKAAQ